MINKIYKSDILILSLPLLLYLSMFRGIPFYSHFDELAAALGLVFLFIGMTKKRIRDKLLPDILLLGAILFLGLVSNFLYGVIDTPGYILNDMYSFCRIFFVYLGALAILEYFPSSARRVAVILGKVSEYIIYILFVFGILNLFGLVNMSILVRYGIRNYSFVFDNASIFGIFIGATIAFHLMSNKPKFIAVIFGFILLGMTLKGTSLIIAMVYLLLRVIRKDRIKVWQILLIGLGLSIVLSYHIRVYLMDLDAPRSVLIYYGFVTAITYFPFGAGFAAYGSNMAAVHYSPLYYEYSFDTRKALGLYDPASGTGIYLNDTYLGMIMGEFGFIGTVLFGVFFYRVWNRINKCNTENKKSKHMIISLFVCLCGSFVMLGSIKNSPGEILLFAIALFLSINSHSSKTLVKKEVFLNND